MKGSSPYLVDEGVLPSTGVQLVKGEELLCSCDSRGITAQGTRLELTVGAIARSVTSRVYG